MEILRKADILANPTPTNYRRVVNTKFEAVKQGYYEYACQLRELEKHLLGIILRKAFNH